MNSTASHDVAFWYVTCYRCHGNKNSKNNVETYPVPDIQQKIITILSYFAINGRLSVSLSVYLSLELCGR